MSRTTDRGGSGRTRSLGHPVTGGINAAAEVRRSRVAVTVSLTVLGLLWIVPGLALRPMHDPAWLGFGTGLAVGLGGGAVRALSNARGPHRGHYAQAGLLTVRTWTGPRTVDLRSLRSVRARRIASRFSSITYLVVTDTAGVRVSVSGHEDIQLVRRELDRQSGRGQPAAPVTVSRLARGVLGSEPLPKWLSGLWSLGSIELTAMLGLGCAFTIIVWIAQ